MGHIAHGMFHPSDATSKGRIIQEQNFGNTSFGDGMTLHLPYYRVTNTVCGHHNFLLHRPFSQPR
jgi:hypothetical protein